MKKISILGLHLSYGGIEQAIINQANMLRDDYEVTLAVTYKMSDKPAFKINRNVKVIYLTDLKPNREKFKRAVMKKDVINILKEGFLAIKILKTKNKTMKEYIKRNNADILISSRIEISKLIKKYANKEIIKIAEEHTYSLNNKKYIKRIKKYCTNFDFFVCVSKKITEEYQKILPSVKCFFIPNALNQNYKKVQTKYDTKNIISVGRLSKEKGFDDAIKIIDLLAKKDSDIKYSIIGEGEERSTLTSQIKKNNLEKNVFLYGFKDGDYIKKMESSSCIYLSTSHEESFGTAIIEAAACGLPSVIFNSAKGPLEIVKNNKNGMIIEHRNTKKAAEKIYELINDKNSLEILGKNALLESENYSFEKIKNKWVNLIDKALKQQKIN